MAFKLCKLWDSKFNYIKCKVEMILFYHKDLSITVIMSKWKSSMLSLKGTKIL